MLNISKVIIVEGKYDKIKLENIVNAKIISLDGFKIYNNLEKRELIKKLAQKTGIIILTDSDSAGRRLRNYIRNIVGEFGEIVNVYVPIVNGKERRKNVASKENILGVEGLNDEIIINALQKFNCENINNMNENEINNKITKLDFFLDGLSGGQNSANKRLKLCKFLDLPVMSANNLLSACNVLLNREEYKIIINKL